MIGGGGEREEGGWLTRRGIGEGGGGEVVERRGRGEGEGGGEGCCKTIDKCKNNDMNLY